MYVKVKVVPKAKKETVQRMSELNFEITVKEPAERNLANGRVRELLAREFGLELRRVRLVTGHHSGSKIFEVEIPDQVD